MSELNNRLALIENSNFNSYYKEFLRRHEDEPLSKTPEWKNNINYMCWIQKKHKEFRKFKGYPPNYVTDKYREEFENWLFEPQKKIRYIKLTVNSSTNDDVIINEIKVFGYIETSTDVNDGDFGSAQKDL